MTSTDSDLSYVRDICHIDASVVGIRRDDWAEIKVGDGMEDRARELMETRRFDILPIVGGGNVREYFVTTEWGIYSSIQQRRITSEDMIPEDTGIVEVVGLLTRHDRLFFFLGGTNCCGDGIDSISGLMSVANLNGREVKVYLFNLLTELEIGLGQAIMAESTDEQLIGMVAADASGSPGEKNRSNAADVLSRYMQDRAEDVDVRFVEYLYLPQLLKAALRTGIHARLDFSQRQFKRTFNPLVDLRNRVTHPNKSLIGHEESVETLSRHIGYLEDGLHRIRRLSRLSSVSSGDRKAL